MNYGGDAADQIVRYSMEGMEHTLRISGSIAKNLAALEQLPQLYLFPHQSSSASSSPDPAVSPFLS